MNAFAYCDASFERSVLRAAGVVPLLSPPCVADTFDPALLAGRDLIYFKLHGLPGEIYWYGDGWLTALRLDQIQAADLTGAVVFVANCFGLTDAGEPDVMVQALLDAGARAVVAGAGENWGALRGVTGPDLLGQWMRRGMRLRFTPVLALRVARMRVRVRLRRRNLSWDERKALEDALEFRLLLPEWREL